MKYYYKYLGNTLFKTYVFKSVLNTIEVFKYMYSCTLQI